MYPSATKPKPSPSHPLHQVLNSDCASLDPTEGKCQDDDKTGVSMSWLSSHSCKLRSPPAQKRILLWNVAYSPISRSRRQTALSYHLYLYLGSIRCKFRILLGSWNRSLPSHHCFIHSPMNRHKNRHFLAKAEDHLDPQPKTQRETNGYRRFSDFIDRLLLDARLHNNNRKLSQRVATHLATVTFQHLIGWKAANFART